MRYLISLLFFIASSVQSEVVRYEYYGDLPFWESPVQSFQGQNPLSVDEAQKLVHVQVGYDQHNRIVDIQTRHGDKFKPFSRGFGTLYLHAVHTKITYSENTEKHHFYDQFGNRISAWGEVWEKRYHMDERGRYVKLDLTNKAGVHIENAYGQAKFVWHYPGDGSVIESRYNLKEEMQPHRPGFEFMRIRLLFDTRGYLRLMQNINEKTELVQSKSGAAQYRYFYNLEGGFDRWEVLDKLGKPALGPTGTAGEQYTFDDKGWTRIAFFNQDYQPDYHASGAVNWHAKYDKFGNMVKRWFTDENLKPIDGRYGFHLVKYVYDEKGMYLIRTELFDAKGNATNSVDGVSKVHYKRNTAGQLLEQRNTDISDQLVVDAWQKFAYRTFQYDNDKIQIGSKDFDENSKLVN